VVCGGETDGGRYCDGHTDIARYDPFAPVAVDLVLLRRARRYHALAGGALDALEQLVRQQRSVRR
jgi:hypothetical protein